ncbi:MAG: DNA replication/repair protein RecF [Chlamydiae bacterium]|nr:DNA replication/repair protein RecF [Chlamydiota bacterium]
MHIEKIYLRHFRNYTQTVVPFHSTTNCIIGDNGSGKSSILEALYFLNTGKSFRTHRLLDLIQHNESEFHLHAIWVREDVPHELQLSFKRGERQLLYNQARHVSFLPLIGLIPFVLLSPEDTAILTGPPAERRRFLDIYLSQSDPHYLYHLGRYQKALQQRNTLLRLQEERGLAPWEELMETSAHYLISKRKEVLTLLEPHCREIMQDLSLGQEQLSLRYTSTLPPSGKWALAWREMRKKEIEIGSTLIGPHRDDLIFILGDKNLSTYGSEGQKRCSLVAMRLAQWRILRDCLGYAPIFGIDDFGAHMDPKRTALLEKLLIPMGQIFLTAPTPSKQLFTTSFCLQAEQGTIHPAPLKHGENKPDLKESSSPPLPSSLSFLQKVP